MPAPADLLRQHRFCELFRDLGWDRAAADAVVPSPDGDLHFRAVAQKRGLVVLHAAARCTLLADRRALRDVQKRLLKSYHEHLAIVSSDEPPKQVWLWAIHQPDGRQVRHREHPFFSADPPAAFLARLDRLGFTLDEEDGATLADALGRIRAALDVAADQDLFTRWPGLARRSDELARRMRAGEPGAFDAFVLLHRPLARKPARRLARMLDLDPEDAEQVVMLVLIEAARRFRPELGYQFGTYAGHWMKQAGQRFGPSLAAVVHVPPHVFWPCFRAVLTMESLAGRGASTEKLQAVVDELRREPRLAAGWPLFRRAFMVDRLPGPNTLADPGPPPDDGGRQDDEATVVRQALEQLRPRHAEVLRLRYGFGGNRQSLRSIGEMFGVSKERVRQLQRAAEDRLRDLLADASTPARPEQRS